MKYPGLLLTTRVFKKSPRELLRELRCWTQGHRQPSTDRNLENTCFRDGIRTVSHDFHKSCFPEVSPCFVLFFLFLACFRLSVLILFRWNRNSLFFILFSTDHKETFCWLPIGKKIQRAYNNKQQTFSLVTVNVNQKLVNFRLTQLSSRCVAELAFFFLVIRPNMRIKTNVHRRHCRIWTQKKAKWIIWKEKRAAFTRDGFISLSHYYPTSSGKHFDYDRKVKEFAFLVMITWWL